MSAAEFRAALERVQRECYSSPHVPPGTVLVFAPDAFRLLGPERPLGIWRPRTFVGEIRELVRDGLAAAFPDLILPPRRPEPPTPEERWRWESRIGLQVLDPAAMVRITGV